MKPIAVFRHSLTEGPGHIATYMKGIGREIKVVAIDRGDTVPADPTPFSGLCFMGGPMSVNDPLPWIPEVLALIRRAMDADIPVIGHCLGGQLMTKALGGTVGANPVKEIGWRQVTLSGPAAREWFGDREGFLSFHWHGETFSLPDGASHLLASDACTNQAWAIGKHLAMQCHIEMTEAMIREWCVGGQKEIHEASAQPTVQSADDMQQDIEARVAALHAVAECAYAKWSEGLKD
ncbi:type 1 glutamine amidotransferase [Methyloversatilis sp.]|uniref:type 1 glutamine amidotransferase n=1 Tax=Methyloversatilis sp. TaxID=2569862 RepID=UPI0027360249|nr:type 1 glutamine amidotransferase [Methyloversatilis sp.]MDP2869896.1 type 1 glutamine amidotransferase [Methyloversatilis sp.]MDP3454167.1 type 1 glutamine amidotransferase [Methyloversatilis sp.]MDP3578333.1 type 1 glutamine amidotransferase [Methyloversatilis sp.]